MQEVVAHWIAECRLMIEQTRLLTLHAAHAMDTRGSQAARKQVKLHKVTSTLHCLLTLKCLSYFTRHQNTLLYKVGLLHVRSLTGLNISWVFRSFCALIIKTDAASSPQISPFATNIPRNLNYQELKVPESVFKSG